MTTEVPAPDSSTDGPSDPELISAVRDGDTDAFSTLTERHRHAATRLANTLTNNPSETETLVNQAFDHILTTLQDGEGPNLALRTYLHTTIRNTHHTETRDAAGAADADTTGDADTADGPEATDTAGAAEDHGASAALATEAFHTLPERWQLVLWHTEIEADTPETIAPLLGLTPNGVTALAYRAKERLRQAYLQAHLAESPPEAVCATVAPLLAAEIRGSLSTRDHTKVSEHLDGCEDCTALHAELADLNHQLVPILAPAVLGPTWAQYLDPATATRSGFTAWFGAAPGRWLSGGAGRIQRVAGRAGRRTAIGAGTVAAAAAAALAVVLLTNGTTPPAPRTPPVAGPPEPTAPPPAPSPDETETPPDDAEPTGPATTAPPAAPPEDPDPSPPPADPPSSSPPSSPPEDPPTDPQPPRPPWWPQLPDLPGLPALPRLPGIPGGVGEPAPHQPPGHQGRDGTDSPGERNAGRPHRPGTNGHERAGDRREHGRHHAGRPGGRRHGHDGSRHRPGRF